ncbi:Ig-like domain-containing protein [Streptomyces sp. NPDC001153]
MSKPSPARALSRLALVTATAVVAGLCTVAPASADTGTYDNSGTETPTSTGTLGTGVGQKLTGAQMVQRARDWVSHQVSYNQSQSFSDSEVGGPYRTDCGGLVDMAWQLTSSPVVTTPSPGIDSSTYSTKLTSWSQLQPGDALAVPGEHINLFAGWTNQANGDFTYIAEDNPSVPTGEYRANIHDTTIDGYAPSSFELLRSNNLAPAIPANFNVTIDANGAALASGQTVTGTVNLTAIASSQGVINSLSYTITGPSGTQTINGGTGASNYAQAWNTTGLPNGTYTISVNANEIDGQNHTYGPVTVTTDNGNTSDSTWSVYNPDTKTMTLFGLGSGGHLGLTKTTNGGASWSNWTEANAYWTLQGTPDAVYDPDTKTTMLFARGSANGAMGISTSSNNGASWSNWTQVNAYWSNFKGDASAVYNPDTKKVTVFARGGDGKIGYTQSSNDGATWSNWAEVNAYWNNFAGDPHVIYNPTTKRMTVFARGGDGRIGYTQSSNDGASWSNWAEVNADWNNFAGDPHVVLNPDTHQMTVFARGGDGKIGYTQSSNDGASWSNWAEVNAYWNNFAGDPHPVYNARTKTISLLARGGDGKIGYTQSSNDGANWSNWAEVNAYWNNFAGDPTATYDPDTTQNTVFALGSGGHMGYTQSSGGGWTNWAEVNAYWTLIGS